MNEDRAARYQRLRRRALMGEAALPVSMLAALTASGGAAVLGDAATAMAGPSRIATGVVTIAIAAVVHELLRCPLAWFRDFVLERRYKLTMLSPATFLAGYARVVLLRVVTIVAGGTVVMWLMGVSPNWWWMYAAVVYALALAAAMYLSAAVLQLPSHRCVPLRRDGLEDRLRTLTARAGAPVVGVFTWAAGGRMAAAPALLVGIGPSRRILLSETLLADHSDQEVEVIVAHELAHHVHWDIGVTLAVRVVLVLLALLAGHAAFSVVPGGGDSELAGLPLVALVAGGVWLGLRPAANALSRAQERRADRFALELTGHSGAFVSATRRLAVRNLSEERPSRLVEILWCTHPPVSARLAAAESWRHVSPADSGPGSLHHG